MPDRTDWQLKPVSGLYQSAAVGLYVTCRPRRSMSGFGGKADLINMILMIGQG